MKIYALPLFTATTAALVRGRYLKLQHVSDVHVRSSRSRELRIGAFMSGLRRPDFRGHHVRPPRVVYAT